MSITINNHTKTHDEGVHLAWVTSPWSSSQWLGPLLLFSKVWLHVFTMLKNLWKMFHQLQNAQELLSSLFLHWIWLNTQEFMISPSFYTNCFTIFSTAGINLQIFSFLMLTRRQIPCFPSEILASWKCPLRGMAEKCFLIKARWRFRQTSACGYPATLNVNIICGCSWLASRPRSHRWRWPRLGLDLGPLPQCTI